jgi:hypothetical protein
VMRLAQISGSVIQSKVKNSMISLLFSHARR